MGQSIEVEARLGKGNQDSGNNSMNTRQLVVAQVRNAVRVVQGARQNAPIN